MFVHLILGSGGLLRVDVLFFLKIISMALMKMDSPKVAVVTSH